MPTTAYSYLLGRVGSGGGAHPSCFPHPSYSAEQFTVHLYSSRTLLRTVGAYRLCLPAVSPPPDTHGERIWSSFGGRKFRLGFCRIFIFSAPHLMTLMLRFCKLVSAIHHFQCFTKSFPHHQKFSSSGCNFFAKSKMVFL